MLSLICLLEISEMLTFCGLIDGLGDASGFSMVFLYFCCLKIVAWFLCVLGCDRPPGCSQPLAWPNKLAGIYCSTLLLVGINISLCLRWLGMEYGR